MIKIKKVYLKNFKGIKVKSVFDFEDAGVNVLSGPNGFGKTTLFDVIELCLTGGFKRIEYFDRVQKKTTHRNKPFFQNTDGEDVVVKLWIHDSTRNVDYIIIKHYDDQNSPTRFDHGRDFIPADAHNLFFTYLETDTQVFSSDSFSSLTAVDQRRINTLFYGTDSTIELSATYYLFNYIQQEDSIYFLRKDEDDKGASLGFLFNIAKEEGDKQKIGDLRNSLHRQQTVLQEQINQIKESLPDIQRGEYKKLFDDKDIAFDRPEPFDSIESARANSVAFQDTLASLTLLRNNFSPDEYEKSLKFKKLNEEVIDNQSILKAILLKKIHTVSLAQDLENTNAKVVKANSFLVTSNTAFIQKDYFDLFATPESYQAYLQIESDIRQVEADLGAIGRIISELNSERAKVQVNFLKLTESGHISANHCPLCNAEFETFDKLIEAIAGKTSSLEDFNRIKLLQRKELEKKIKPVHASLLVNAQKFLAENQTTEPLVIASLREYSSFQERVNSLFETYSILSGTSADTIILSDVPRTMREINDKLATLKEFLIRDLLTELQYNDQLIQNKNLYIQYFDSDRAKFGAVTVEMLSAKLLYLQGSYALLANTRLLFLDSRLAKLSSLHSRVSQVFDKVHRTIQEHKVELIEKIKVPFYIYSGKILQSYQQGLGIFVQIHETDLSNNVQFKTGHSSDHDVVYHLSSGQMAVVSLAFCLSLNKVYNTNQNFKFLAIDDPIQTMDDLNIHTFIELVRNEFQEYQIIMSTHDDFTSRYMKYKFDKFDMTTVIQNVQRIVLQQSFN